MKALFVILLTIQLSACLKVSNIPEDNPHTTNTAPEVQVATQGTPQSPQVQALDAAKAYQVHLPFPQEATIARRYEKDNESSLQAIPIKIENGVLTDDQVVSGAHYVYQFGVIESGNFKELQSYEISIPLDLLVDREIVLTEDQVWNQYRRIFFTSEGKITTQGLKLSIQADQLISSKGGLIRSFPSGSQAVDGVGRVGGTVEISLRTAKGDLKVELRGQRGANGASGGKFPLKPIPPQTVTIGGDLLNSKRVYSPGRKGVAGLDGQLGGNSGSGEIKILERHSLYVLPIVEAGEGGAGGAGGPGEQYHSAQVAGTPGDSGVGGKKGEKGRLCLYDERNTFCM